VGGASCGEFFATCVNSPSPGRHRRVTGLALPPATWLTIQSRTAPQTSSTVPATARVTGVLAPWVYMILARRPLEPSPSRQTRRTRTAAGSVLGTRRLWRGSVTGPLPARCRHGRRIGEGQHGNVCARVGRARRADGQAHAHARREVRPRRRGR